MSATWEEVKVDRQVERAWLDMRLELADWLVAALDAGHLDPVDFTAPTGQTLTVSVADGHAVVAWGSNTRSTTNVDRAAHTVMSVLRSTWGVVHPAFVSSPLVRLPEVEEPAEAAPVLAHAESVEQLQHWVELAFQEDLDVPLVVDDDGDIRWQRDGGAPVVVRVKNARRIEIFTVLGTEVGFSKAHRVIDRLSRDFFGLKFFLYRDRLIMSQTVIAAPFCPEQLRTALAAFMSDAGKLGWVATEVLSKRARVEREDAEELKAEVAAAQAERDEALENVQQAEQALADAIDEAKELGKRIALLEHGQAMMADQLERYQELVERMKQVPQRPPVARPRKVPLARPSRPSSQDDNTRSEAA